MDLKQIIEEHNKYLSNGGFRIIDRGLIKISGPDTEDFLQRMTSQNIKALPVGGGAPTALLQPNSMIISLLNTYRLPEFYYLSCEENNLNLTYETLEKFHFGENLEISKQNMSCLSVQGTNSQSIIRNIFEKCPDVLHGVRRYEVDGAEVLVASESDFNESGFHIYSTLEGLKELIVELEKQGLCELSEDLYRLLRRETHHFEFGNEITEKNLALEAPLDDHVSRNKGCYPGQEVVERIFTYGNVAKKLVLFEAQNLMKNQSDAQSLVGKNIVKDNANIGLVTSAYYIPWSEKTVIFAFVRKPHFSMSTNVNIQDLATEFEVKLPPHSFQIENES